ncbi:MULTISPECIES: energy-coupling factor transporter transmembrane component T family protein [Oceanotoga]|jgi:energy-coupling factor transport system permease protein|uniref:energy-coupling factor transporter transmembrane component T family protein n=1 Tax=Oceanotoga TaxID=1255275 RepID=UPI002652A3D4|nr:MULTISPECIES: energy-coupling factor transporter transmembrane component T [Oceanotoga]MDN5343279.1 energy-coupling factor transport system permease protein [Oceanotoga sp.]MDO7977411.1 energy-coupling factor transporter transmembrane protein EcfT [Oceanotoga teriensis]
MFIDNVALGRYVEKNSLMHKLDPRAKLLGLFVLAGFAFSINSAIDIIVMSVYTIILMLLSKLSLTYYTKSLKSIWFIVVFAFIIQLFSVDGDIIFKLGFIKLTDKGLFNATIITFRILFAIMLSSVLTLTTSPTSLAHAMEDVLRWLFVPKSFAHELSMVMTIAIRFIPVMASEADRIIKAQLSRGANFDDRKFSGKVKGAVSIIIPLLVSALRRAEELSVAMEARGYSGWEGRTRYKKFEWEIIDTLFTLSFILIGVTIIII